MISLSRVTSKEGELQPSMPFSTKVLVAIKVPGKWSLPAHQL